MIETGRAFLDESRALLTGDYYLGRLRRALEPLSTEDVWWRPDEAANSIGNLLLHLAGNARQWIVAGVGGAPDERRRADEFAARDSHEPGALLDHVAATLAEIDGVLARVDPAALGERRTIQGQDVTVLEAIYHVVEHFAMHTGQILYIAKLRTGADLRLYRVDADGVAERDW